MQCHLCDQIHCDKITKRLEKNCEDLVLVSTRTSFAYLAPAVRAPRRDQHFGRHEPSSSRRATNLAMADTEYNAEEAAGMLKVIPLVFRQFRVSKYGSICIARKNR